MNEVISNLVKKATTFKELNIFINGINELILSQKLNAYIPLDNLKTEYDFYRYIVEGISYYTASNHWTRIESKKILDFINFMLGTNFNKKQSDLIYIKMGNSVNKDLTKKFIESKFDLSVLNETQNKPQNKPINKLTRVVSVKKLIPLDEKVIFKNKFEANIGKTIYTYITQRMVEDFKSKVKTFATNVYKRKAIIIDYDDINKAYYVYYPVDNRVKKDITRDNLIRNFAFSSSFELLPVYKKNNLGEVYKGNGRFYGSSDKFFTFKNYSPESILQVIENTAKKDKGKYIYNTYSYSTQKIKYIKPDLEDIKNYFKEGFIKEATQSYSFDLSDVIFDESYDKEIETVFELLKQKNVLVFKNGERPNWIFTLKITFPFIKDKYGYIKTARVFDNCKMIKEISGKKVKIKAHIYMWDELNKINRKVVDIAKDLKKLSFEDVTY